MFKFLRAQKTKIRLAVGLTSIAVTFMLIGSFLKILPDADDMNVQAHVRVAQVVAANGTLLVSQGDLKRMEAVLADIIIKDPGIKRASITTADGEELIVVGEAKVSEGWNNISVPIWSGKSKWGTIALSFKQLHPPVWYAFYEQPLVRYILLVSLLCFIAFYFYLGRMLKVLDPSQAIPDRVRSALDTMAEGLLVLDAKYNIVLANQAFSHIVDKSQGDLVGMNSARFEWLNTDGAQFNIKQSPWAMALRRGRPVMGKRIRLKLNSGFIHTFMVNCSPVLGDKGKAGGVLISFDDVTVLEQKEIELILSKEEAEVANKSKSDFLANMSHEIRTPMTAIVGFSEVLRRGYGNGEKSMQYLDTITKNSNHLLELINDILDLSKVESGQIEVEKNSVKVYQVIGDVVEILNISAKNKNIDLTYEPQGDMPVEVVTDSGRVRQILTNLIGNAIKFTQSGGVTVKSVWDEENNRVRVEVVDTGIGMTESQASHVFEPFVQADSSITRRFGGTGLGLTISKRYAEALGGDISVHSDMGKGSCFTLLLDAGEANMQEMVSIEKQKEISAHLGDEAVYWKMPEANILVVDDSEENRDLLELLLHNQGLNLDTVDDGLAALKQVNEKDYNMVLMDVQMPGMDGYTAVKKMREQGIDLPVYALTAHAMKGIEQKCLNAGFSGYIAKPIQIDFLIETVAKCVGGERLSKEEAEKIPTLTPTLLPLGLSSTDPANGGWVSGQAIASTLQDNPRYLPIIAKFVNKLDLQLEALCQYKELEQFDAVFDLAHKLKGSAGTVGYSVFTEPFHKLEMAANDIDQIKIDEYLELIKNMSRCIDRDKLSPSKNSDEKIVNSDSPMNQRAAR